MAREYGDDMATLEDAQDAQDATEEAGGSIFARDLAIKRGAPRPPRAPDPAVVTKPADDDERPSFLEKPKKSIFARDLAAKLTPRLSGQFSVTGGPAPAETGNIDLRTRPSVLNPDGSRSSVRSMSFQDAEGGPEILIPTVSDEGKVLSDDDAIALYRRTGRHLGKFKTPDEATAYAQRLHRQQEAAGPTPETRPFKNNTGPDVAGQLRAEAAAIPKPSVADYVGSSFRRAAEGAKTVGRIAVDTNPIVAAARAEPGDRLAAAGRALADPLTNPARRREFERGLSDTITLGQAQRLGEFVDPAFAATAADDAREAPGFRAFGGTAGAFAPSFHGALAGKVARSIPEMGVLTAPARAVAGYEAFAIPTAAALAPPGEKLQAMGEAATDPAGLALAAGVPLAAQGIAKGGAKLVKKIAEGAPDRRVGRALADIEEGGGKKAKAALRDAEPEAREALRENPELVKVITSHPTPKNDAKLLAAADVVGKRGGNRLNSLLEAADNGEMPHQQPVEAVPEPISPDLERTQQLRDPNFRPQPRVAGEIVDMPLAPIERPETPTSLEKTQRLQIPNFETKDLAPRNVSAETGYVPLAGGPPPPPPKPGPRLPPPQGSSVSPEGLFDLARDMDTEAVRLTAKAERHARQAKQLANPEMSAAEDRRAQIAEIRADDARQRAAAFRARAEKIENATPPKDYPGYKPSKPEKYLEPEIISSQPIPSGPRPSDAVANMDRSIKRLIENRRPDDHDTAVQLMKIRDEFAGLYADGGPDAPVPSRLLKDAQSDYQRRGYAKTIPGMPDAEVTDAKIRAYRQAQKDVGDVIVKHVTGMSYEDARTAAAADPKSVAGQYIRANDDVMVANRIRALVDSRKGNNHGAPNRLSHLIHGVKHSAATTAIASTLGHEAASLYALGALGYEAAPYVARGVDNLALRALPLADRVAGRPVTGGSAAGLAKLIQAGRAGASRQQLLAQAEQDGVDPVAAEELIGRFHPTR